MNIRTDRAAVLTGAATALLALLTILPAPARPEEGTPPPPIPRVKDMSYYLALVITTLPSFSSSMITVPNGPAWMAGKTVAAVAAAMLDSPPGTILTSGQIVMGFDPPDGPRYIKIDFGDAYIRHANQDRSFRAGLPCTAVPATSADAAFTATVGALGLPTSEWDARTVDLVMERGVDGEAQDPTPELICQVERMVTMTRKAANGYPIFGSIAREAISNAGERARLLIEWPRFVMATGLVMRTRTEVVADLAQRILAAESNGTSLGAEVDLEIRLGYAPTPEGYVPVARAAFLDIYARFPGQVVNMPLAYNPSSEVATPGSIAEVQFRTRIDPVGGIAVAEFFLPRPESVRLAIVDVTGREVATVADGAFSAGWHQVSWNLRDRENRRVSSGVYFARLEAGRESPTRKLLVVH